MTRTELSDQLILVILVLVILLWDFSQMN